MLPMSYPQAFVQQVSTGFHGHPVSKSHHCATVNANERSKVRYKTAYVVKCYVTYHFILAVTSYTALVAVA